MKSFSTRVFSVALAAALCSGCGTKVTRVTHDSTVDLSGSWNDTDSRLVAEEMVKDLLGAGWYREYAAKKKIPRVVLGKIRNKTHEHISTETFIKDIQRYLINSGQVEFVASKSERQELREEKSDQEENAAAETRQKIGAESGAELMLLGSLNSIIDQEGGKSVVFYQVNLEFIHLETNKKLWIGDKKIKKLVEKSGSSL